MEFTTKVTQRLRRVRTLGRLLREDGLINTTDLLVATGATVILAAGIAGASLSALDAANYGKAQPDAQAIANAIFAFYQDTGKWPGQVDHANNQTAVVLLATGATAGDSTPSADDFTMPSSANDGLEWNAHTDCSANSSQGWVNGDVAAGSFSTTTTTEEIPGTTRVLNLNDYLVREPSATDYPNWKGPYVQEIALDPWDRAWVAYLTPLYCAEGVSSTSASGDLGYAWLITGGANRTVTTKMTSAELDPNGDDAGVNLGKLSAESAGSVSQ